MASDDLPQTDCCEHCRAPMLRQNGAGLCAACLLDKIGNVFEAADLPTVSSDWLEFSDEAGPTETPLPLHTANPVGEPAALPSRFGPYELLGEIARGGMGIVYRARQRQPARTVALKILLPRQAATANTLARFRAEAAMVASLDHPHLLPVYEAGERDGLPFFSMKLVEGGSLARRTGEFAGRYRAAAQLVLRAAGAVHHAHQRGILHRDLKPGNILLDGEADPAPFVTDFGIAKWLDRDSALTLTHDVLGTPAYAAPEQASPGLADVTTAVDVYGLGAVLYELLTQRPPFAGATTLETLRKVVDEPPAAPRVIDPDVPRDLETICLKCLQKDPRARYASAAGLAADLERFLAGETVLARPAKMPERIWRWSKRNPVLASLWTALAVLLAALAVGSVLSNRRLQTQNRRAVQAEKTAVAARNEATENLRASYLVGAHALRGTARAGHRYQALALLEKAAAIRPGFDLRNEAIAALALTDLALEKQWKDAKDGRYGPLAFDPTLQLCASNLPGQTTSIWRFADRQPLCTLQFDDADTSRVYSLGPWSGTHLPLVTENGTVRVYHTDPAGQARPAFVLPSWCPTAGELEMWNHVAFSPDGKVMAIRGPGGDGVSLRDPDDGHELGRLARGHRVDMLFYNADGSRLVLAQHRGTEARLWNIAGDREERTYPAGGDILYLAISAPDRFVALGTVQSTINLVDYASGETLQKLRTSPRTMGFGPGATLFASTGRDLALSLWEPRTGNLLVSAPGLTAEPALRFTADGARVAIDPYDDGAVGTLRLQHGDCVRAVSLPLPMDAGFDFNSTDVSPDGRLLAAATHQGVWLGDLHTGRELGWWLLDPADKDRITVQFTADGRGLVASSKDSGRWYRALTWEGPSSVRWGRPRLLDGSLNWTLTTHRLPGGVGGFVNQKTNEVCIRPVETPGSLDDPKGHMAWDKDVEGVLWQALLTPDGRYLATSAMGYASATDQGCRVWDAATRKLVYERKPAPGGVVAFSPSGKYLYANARPIALLDTTDWHEVFTIPYDTDDAAFSPDERLLAVRDDSRHDDNPGTFRLFAVPSGKPLAVLETAANQASFSPNGRYLIAMGEGSPLQIWDLHAIRRELRKMDLDWDAAPIPDDGPPPPPIILRDEAPEGRSGQAP